MKANVRELIRSVVGTKEKIEINEALGSIDNLEITDPIVGDVVLTNLGDIVLADFDVHLLTKLECVKCLDSFGKKQSLKFSMEYLNENHEDDSFAGKYYVDNNNEIDLTEPIRQEFGVSIPPYAICHSACKGLCANCGVNWNMEDCECDDEAEKLDPDSRRLGDIARRRDL